MQNTVKLAMRREGTEITYEKLPISFYDKEIFEERKATEHKSVMEIYSSGKLVKRLKAERAYMQEVQNTVQSNVYFGVNSVQEIKRISDSPLVEKVILEGGEIEFRVNNGQITVCSKRYSKDKEATTTYSVSKTLRQDVSSYEALRNAEAGVFNRLAQLEFQKRADEIHNGLVRYEQKREIERIAGLKTEDMKNIDPEIMKTVIEMEEQKIASKKQTKILQFHPDLAIQRARNALDSEFFVMAS